MKRKMALLLIPIFLNLGCSLSTDHETASSGANGSTTLVTINFETGNLSQCDSVKIGGTDSLTAANPSPLHGNYGLKFVSSGVKGVNTYVEKTFAPKRLIYARTYFYLDPDTYKICPLGDGDYVVLFGLYTADGNPAITVGMTNDYEPYRLFVPQYWDDTKDYKPRQGTINFGLHYVDLYYSYGSGNGTWGIYLDGALWDAGTGLDNAAIVPDRVRAGVLSMWSGYTQAGSIIYFDDIKVATKLIGAS